MPCPRYFIIYALFIFATIGPPSAFAGNEPFVISDYFKLKRVTELALSSDGEMIAYVVESVSLKENRTLRSVYVIASTAGATSELIYPIQDAHSISWIPGRHELAFLFKRSGVTQLFSYNIGSKTLQQHTRSENPVVSFQFAPDGHSLSWLTQVEPNSNVAHFYDRLFHGDEGVVIDSENTIGYQFINPDWPDPTVPLTNTLWVRRVSDGDFQADIPGRVISYYWSSDSSKLSISYVAEELPPIRDIERLTSFGILDAYKNSFRIIARARMPLENQKAEYFRGGEWLVGAEQLFVRRVTEENTWHKHTSWTLIDLSEKMNLNDKAIRWHDIIPFYSADPEPAFIPSKEGVVYSVQTVKARRSLYEIRPSGLKRASILKNVKGAVSLIQFSADFNTAAFVNESFSRPPEVYVWQKGDDTKKLTHLNAEIFMKQLPTVEEVTWKSKDGVSVQGWFIEPALKAQTPWPLLTFVHGGPRKVFVNQFVGEFDSWPYPFEVFALSGIAVFIPNYRGTGTFGDEFDERKPSRLDREPVEDIVSGINYLIDKGIADPERLAISGFSHGSWLASLVMTRMRTFKAGAFAEGTQNMIVLYHLMPGWLNRDIHDVHNGVSVYEDPQYYIDMSPDLHFEGLNAAVLFEAGVKVSAIGMMGSPKAARRAGMPAEFVVYPKIGHSMTIPHLQRESATRNLDWFRYWLLNEKDPDPAKTMQYKRWSEMRSPDS